MVSRTTAVIIVGLCAVAARADYVSDREAAIELVKAGKHSEAMDAFLRMAEGKVSEVQKSDALEQASICAVKLKKYGKAMELAEAIPLEPVSKTAQMRIMQSNRKRAELIEKFKNENISMWPEKDAGRAFYYRGEAYHALRDGESAESDLKRALENLAGGYMHGLASLTLAHNYRNNLKDEKKALDAYISTQAIERQRDKWGWMYFTSVTAAADILRGQRKYDQALEMLGQVELRKMGNGYWKVALLCSHAEVHASQGNKGKALAAFREALEVKGIRDRQKASVQKRVQALQKDAAPSLEKNP